MTLTFTWKQDDTNTLIEETLTFADPDTVTAGATVKLIIKNLAAGTSVQRTATVVSATAGQLEVSYQLVAGDTAVAGDFIAEWEVTLNGGKIQTFPENGWIRIKILPDLA